MKATTILKKSVLLPALAGFALQAGAQSIDERYELIRSGFRDTKVIIPAYLFDSLATMYQDGVAGTQVKEGKIKGSSLSLEDKGATVNLAFKNFKLGGADVYSAIQVAGTTDDKFVTIFKDGKYQNTISGGGVFNIFPRQFYGSAYTYDRLATMYRIQKIDSNVRQGGGRAWDIDGQAAYLTAAVEDLIKYRDLHCRYKYMDDAELEAGMKADYPTIIDKGEKAMDTLKKLGVLDASFQLDNACDLEAVTLKKSMIDRGYLKKLRYVRACEDVYMNAPWTKFHLMWFTVGANYNVGPKPIIDAGLTGPEHYVRNYNSEYVRFSLAFNILHVKNWGGRPFQYTLSPSLSLSNERYFNDDDKIKLSKQTKYVVNGNDTLTKTEYTAEGFEKLADRKTRWSVEVPINLLWTRHNFGLDLAARVGGNDPRGDNAGGRIGVFIPIELTKDAPVWIEPMFRIGKLSKETNAQDFFKTNVSFGFNLSVALKNYMLLGKKG